LKVMLAWQGPEHVSVWGTKGMLTPKSWATRASLLVKLTVTVELRGTLIDARSKARLRALTAMVTGPEGAGGAVGWGAGGYVGWGAGGCVDAAGGVAVGSGGGVGELMGCGGAVAAAAEVAGDVAAGTVLGPTVAVCVPWSSQARVSAVTRSIVRSRTRRFMRGSGVTSAPLPRAPLRLRRGALRDVLSVAG
jgi:hypothetical protein